MHTADMRRAGIVSHTALTVAVACLTAGCGVTVEGESAQGQPTSNGQASVEWNPCSQLPEEALRAVGADPSEKTTAYDAPGDQALFRVCAWDSLNGPYHVGVGSTTLAQNKWYDNTEATGVSPRRINSRSGLTFYPANGAQPIRQCYVSLPTTSGSLFVNVDWEYSQRSSLPESPPCELAVETAQKLEPYLPK